MGDVEVDAAEAGGLDVDATFDEPDEVVEAFAGEAEVVYRYPGQSREQAAQVLQFAVGDVQLDMPAAQVVHAQRHVLQFADVFRAAALQVEAHGAHAGLIEREDVPVRCAGGQLCDADEGRAEPAQCVDQVALVEALERSRHDGAAGDAQWCGARKVVIDRERGGQEALVRRQREAGRDDVQVCVEDGHGPVAPSLSAPPLRGGRRALTAGAPSAPTPARPQVGGRSG